MSTLFVFDENMSPLLASGMAELTRDDDYKIGHVRVRYEPKPREGDVPWLQKAGAERIPVVAITTDHGIRRRKHELAAWQQNLACGVVLPRDLKGRWNVVAFTVRWWEQLVKECSAAARGTMLFIPYRWTPRPLKDKERLVG